MQRALVEFAFKSLLPDSEAGRAASGRDRPASEGSEAGPASELAAGNDRPASEVAPGSEAGPAASSEAGLSQKQFSIGRFITFRYVLLGIL